MLASPKKAAPIRPDNVLLDVSVYISYAFYIVGVARLKGYPKPYRAIFWSNTQLRRFYSQEYTLPGSHVTPTSSNSILQHADDKPYS